MSHRAADTSGVALAGGADATTVIWKENWEAEAAGMVIRQATSDVFVLTIQFNGTGEEGSSSHE
jgi:hypothetical protein